jgi:protein required for attachment to host cells
MTPHWFLVADASRAWVYSQKHPDDLPELVRGFQHDESRKRTSELVGDRPGRAPKTQAGARAVFSQGTDPAEVEKDLFADELMSFVIDAMRSGKFFSMSIIAPPPMLGRLRARTSATLSGRVIHERPHDYTRMKDADLRNLLRDMRPHVPLAM